MELRRLILKKYSLMILAFSVTGILLYGTNPNYEQHESLVAEVCNSKSAGSDMPVCPLGYGKKGSSDFDRESFSVYSAGILSYSVYQEKLSSFGILGNVFLYSNINEA